MMLRVRWSLVLSCVLLLSACGSDSSPTQAGGSGSISATIDGAAWSANAPFASAIHNVSGQVFTLNAADPSATYGMAISLGEFGGAGTYEIRPGFPLRMAVVTLGASPGWGTEYAATPGVITITTLTETRAQGTFSFTADPSPSASVTGTLVVTQGQFDVPVTRVGN
jgi:hypothetical protein